MAALLTGEIATTTGPAFEMAAPGSIQASVVGTGAVAASVVIEVSNGGGQWLELGTITLSGTTSDSDGFAYSARWSLIRARLTSISGTGAAVTCVMTGTA